MYLAIIVKPLPLFGCKLPSHCVVSLSVHVRMYMYMYMHFDLV